MIYCLLFLLLFTGCSGAPGGRKSLQTSTVSPTTPNRQTEISSQIAGENIENEPPTDIPALFEVQVEEGDYENCYFRKERKSIFEKHPRNRESEVSTRCEGVMKKIGELINEKKFNEDSGVLNSADLIMARGASTYVNWENPEEGEKVKELFICKYHEEELLRQWTSKILYRHMKYKRTKDGKQPLICSMPEGSNGPYGKVAHPNGRVAEQGKGVTRKQAEVFLRQEGMHLHISLPICRAHREYLENLVNEKNAEMTEDEVFLPSAVENSEYLDECDELANIGSLKISDDSKYQSRDRYEQPKSPYRGIIPENVRQKVLDFMKTAELIVEEPKKYFEEFTVRHKRRILSKFKSATELVADVLTRGDPYILMEHFSFQNRIEDNTYNNDKLQKLLNEVSDAYLNAPTRQERRLILGTVTHVVTYPELLRFIPELNEYEFTQSRKELNRIKRGEEREEKKIIRIRRDPESINRFIEFITQPPIAIPLPYMKTKRGPGRTTYQIPEMIRTLRDTQIINLFRKQQDEDGFKLKLSNSSMRAILKICSASRQKSMDCVDSFFADGLLGFADIQDIIEELLEKSKITKDEAFGISSLVKEFRLYLQSDYYVHINEISNIAEFCMNYALSDPQQKQFKAQHCTHEFHCPRCQMWSKVVSQLRDVLSDLNESIKTGSEKFITATDLDFMDIKFETAKEYIREWQKHIVRNVYSDTQLAEIIKNLGDNECIATMDYAQKYLPKEFTEKQESAFGKAGLSWHITHVIARREGKLVQRTFVHLMGFVKQDYDQVSAILRDTLLLLKKDNIENVTLRSDNAGYYHSGKMFAIIPALSKETGVFIKRYSFSETQNGKSSADRETGRCKRMMTDYIDAGNDITSAEQMFFAFEKFSQLAAITVRQGNVKSPQLTFTSKIPNIRQIGEVEYSKRGTARMWRFYHIGEGMPYDFSPYIQMKSGVFTAEKNWDSTEKGLPLWRELGSKAEKIENPERMKNKDYNDQVVYTCPEERCGRQFSTLYELEEHKQVGDHDSKFQKITTREYIINQYNKVNEERSGKVKTVIDSALDPILKNLELEEEIEPLGWALPSKHSYSGTNKDVKQFIDEKVRESVKNNQRPDAKKIFQAMNTATLNGKVRFPKESRLKVSQINSRITKYYYEYENNRQKKPEEIMESALKELEDNEGDPEVEILDSEFIVDPFDEVREIYYNQNEEDESSDIQEITTTPSTSQKRRQKCPTGDEPKSKKRLGKS